MIHNPLLLIFVLIAVEFSILYLSSHTRTKYLFNFLPSMFWIYFLPMVLSTFGMIDPKSPLYQGISTWLLPPALFLLLLNVDIKAIIRLGPVSLIMFFAGAFGIMLGMVMSFAIFKPLIGAQFWGGFGALAASWTGGSANMIAVKEALNTPDSVFLPMVIVDTIVPYVWMGILVACVGSQKRYDQWNNSDRKILDDLESKKQGMSLTTNQSINLSKAIFILVLAFSAGLAAKALSIYLPNIKGVISSYSWAIILVSTVALCLSMTPLSRIPQTGSNKFGYWLLYFVLTSIGARASLNNAAQSGILIAAGSLVVLVHVLMLVVIARLIRAPLFLIVTSSQANIGGVASAPVVAEVYQPGFSSIGLLLAILGNIIGTYAGILTGQICRLFVH